MTNKITSTSRWFIFMLVIQSLHLVGQTKEQAAQITSSYDMKKLESLKEEFRAQNKADSIAVTAYLKKKRLKKRTTLPNGNIVELQRIDPDGTPVYYTTYNTVAAQSTRTNHLHTGGSLGLNLMGANMTAHVWDGGIARASHREYDGAGGNDRYSVGDGSTNLGSHAAHVTGTIMASGVTPSAKGMAPYSKVVGYDWTSDLVEATAAAASGMLVSNHSYGQPTSTAQNMAIGAYLSVAANWDNLMRTTPYYLMVCSAGNDGNSNNNGAPLDPNFPQYDKLTGFKTAKNNLVVANAQSVTVDANGNVQAVTIHPNSSQGPTDDLRIKPDITGYGTSIYSTLQTSDDDYGNLTGTSMAAANVSGSLLLLQEHYHNRNGNFMKAATLKGLVLHTADDAGPAGPDAIFGWGLLNAKKAAETITQKDVNTIISELSIAQGQTITLAVKALGNTPLKASISWTDFEGVLGYPAALRNDLDIRITKAGVTSLPWRLTGVNTNDFGDNTKDPYERIDINNASGDYIITITHKGNLVGNGGVQNVSLLVTGIDRTCNPTIPTNLAVTSVNSTTATLTWTSTTNTSSYQVQYRAVGSPNWLTANTTSNTITLTGLAAPVATTYEVQVRSICSVSITSTTSDYGTSVNFTTPGYCASKGITTSDEYIGRVQLNTINNPSAAENGGYSNFTNLSTNLSKGNNYTITVTPTWTSHPYLEGYSASIDFNNNQVFEANEVVWSQDITIATPVSGTFFIPYTATNGPTRMRVSMAYNFTPNPCGTFNFGEVEDYTVIIGETGSPLTPTNFYVTDVKPTAATLIWDAVSNAIHQVQYRVAGSSEWTTTNLATNSLILTGLTSSTNYEAQVRSISPNGSVSAFSPLVNFTTVGYCVSIGGNPSEEHIARVQFNTIDHLSEAGTDGYSNFTNVSTNVSKGTTYTLTITPTTTWNWTEGYAVWIDFNNNGIFDASEMIWSQSPTSASSVYTIITIPTYAAEGSVRMRVSMKYAGVPTECEIFSYGEVEDYTIVIGSNTVPSPPINLTATDTNQNALKLNWNAPAGISNIASYAIYRNGILIGNSLSTMFNVTGLSPETTYDFYVKAIGVGGNLSDNSNTVSVTTLPYCTSRGLSTYDQWINQVQLGSINSISGDNGGYANFSNLSTNLTKGDNNLLTMIIEKKHDYAYTYRIWIDYNKNGVFDDTEIVYEKDRTYDTTITGTIVIPTTALTGQTRMCIAMKWSTFPSACETFSFGEVEDYTVNIIDGYTTTAVESAPAKSEKLYVYPNPTDSELFLSSTENVSKIAVYNTLGQEVMQTNVTDKLDVSHLSNGLYIVNVLFENGTMQTVKFNKK